MAQVCQSVRLAADLTMHVPRDAAGDLECGARRVLDSVDAVESVEAVDVTSLTPRLNDLQVEATVTVTVAVGDATDVANADVEAAGRDALAAGFGVVSVEHARLDRSNGTETPVQEYG